MSRLWPRFYWCGRTSFSTLGCTRVAEREAGVGVSPAPYLKSSQAADATSGAWSVPSMSGTELVGRACVLHPRARRVLLTSYADTQALGEWALAASFVHRCLETV